MKRTLLSLCMLCVTLLTHAYNQQSIDINVNGQKRNMICYTPSAMKSNMPLWIVTHGMNQTPEYQRDGDHLYELIDTAKFVVCYLRSDGSTWDTGGTKDQNFVLQTIEEMHTRFGINKNRVYWSGFSMGSMLMYHCMPNMLDKIAAFAPCSGIQFSESPWNNCKKPVNLIHCHGKNDSVFPVGQYDPRGYAMHFKDVNKCTNYKKIENYQGVNGSGDKELWTGGINGSEVEIFMINWLDHTPDRVYSKEIWNFCRRFSLATPEEEYEHACKEASKLLEQWEGDLELFSTLKSSYNSLKTAVEKYGAESGVDTTDEKALQDATSRIVSATDKFTAAINTNIKTSKRVYKDEMDPNFHIYLCLGQGNMEGGAAAELEDYAGASERFLMLSPVRMSGYTRIKGGWYVARPPLCREGNGLTPADYFGKTLVKQLPDSISVGVINVSLGECGIEMFQEEGIADYIKQQESGLQSIAKTYGNNPFRYLVDLAKKAQEAGVIKGILLHQGCANSEQQDWPQKVNAVYQHLLSELGLNEDEVPLLVGELLSKEQGGKYAAHNSIIAKLPTVIANAHVVSSARCAGSDGMHFSTEGMRKLGVNYAEEMLRAIQRQTVEKGYSVKELRAQEASFLMPAASTKPLYLILTDQEGVEHDVTASCRLTASEEGILHFTPLCVCSGNKEGEVTVTATYTNNQGEQVSTTFTVSVQLFPLVKDQFNPSLIKTGTFSTSSTAGRYKSVKGGMGGWYYPSGLDLSGYRYLVASLKGKSLAKPTLRIYDTDNLASESYCTASLTNTTQAVVDLQAMTSEAGLPIDPSHVYIVAFTSENDNTTIIQEVYVTNEDPTALTEVLSDTQDTPATWYDITGRKVNPATTTRGILIKDGRKWVR